MITHPWKALQSLCRLDFYTWTYAKNTSKCVCLFVFLKNVKCVTTKPCGAPEMLQPTNNALYLKESAIQMTMWFLQFFFLVKVNGKLYHSHCNCHSSQPFEQHSALVATVFMKRQFDLEHQCSSVIINVFLRHITVLFLLNIYPTVTIDPCSRVSCTKRILGV